MRILIALAVLVIHGLLVSSERFWGWRRHPLGAVLSTGGWIAVGIGLLLGPHGIQLVTAEHTQVLRPLILFCLGWVGVMVGLQLRRDLPTMLPGGSVRLAMADFLVSVLVVGLLVVGALTLVGDRIDWPAAIVLAVVMGACGVGWSPEVRSLVRDKGQGDTANYLRAAAGIGSLLAVVVYGLAFMLIKHAPGVEADSPVRLLFSGVPLAVGLAVSLVIATMFGLIGSWLMHIAGRSESQFLVILLGLVSFVTGAAATMGFSPLFVAMLCGVVVANVPGDVLTRFKRVIIEAEQPIAMVMMLTAGAIADPRLSTPALAMLVLVLTGRMLVKLTLAAHDRQLRITGPRDSALGMGPVRQAPLAIAMVMGYAVSGHASLTDHLITGGELVMVVILLGLLTDIAPLMRRLVGGKPPAPSQASMPGEVTS